MGAFMNDVEEAVAALRSLFEPTPLQKNAYLSQKYQADIYLKREDLTPVRSYKIRGAFHFVAAMLEGVAPNRPFICASAGNHAQGLAFVCRHFSRPAVIFMPVTTPQQKIDKTRSFGGDFVDIRLIGDTFDQCYAAAQECVAQGGGVMAPPFDDMRIITGQAGVLWEIFQQWEEENPPDMLITPVGGGGLSSGIVRLIGTSDWQTKIHFVEPQGAPSLYESLRAGKRVKLDTMDTFVDGAAVAQIGAENFSILQDFTPQNITLIPENRLCATMIKMLNIEGIVLEPAGALAIDALKDFSPDELRGKKIIAVVSGGNFDFERLPDVKERALRFEGLKKYYIFRFPQRPGALRSFLDMLGPQDDIARFEYLKKSARNFGSVLIAIETKCQENFTLLHQKFDESGWAYRDITNDQVLFDFVI